MNADLTDKGNGGRRQGLCAKRWWHCTFFSICITLRTKSMPEYSRLLVETRDRNRMNVRWSVLYSHDDEIHFAQRKQAVTYRWKSCWSWSSWLGIWDMTRHMMQLSKSSPKSSCWSSKRNRMSVRLGLRWHVMIRNSQWKQIVHWQISRWISWSMLLPGCCFLNGTKKSREIMANNKISAFYHTLFQSREGQRDEAWLWQILNWIWNTSRYMPGRWTPLPQKQRMTRWSSWMSCWCTRRCLIFWPCFLMHMIIVSKIRKGA